MVIAGLFILVTNCPQSRTAEVNYGALFDRLLGGHLSDGASAFPPSQFKPWGHFPFELFKVGLTLSAGRRWPRPALPSPALSEG